MRHLRKLQAVSQDWAPSYPQRQDRKTSDISKVELSTSEPANFRQREGGVDYANFPKNAAYVSVGDVEGAYQQGRQDQGAESDIVIRGLYGQIAILQGQLATLEKAKGVANVDRVREPYLYG